MRQNIILQNSELLLTSYDLEFNLYKLHFSWVSDEYNRSNYSTDLLHGLR